jgi:hypothetical protein
MTAIYFDPPHGDDERRAALYRGDIVVISPGKHSLELCAFAAALIRDAFAGADPEFAQQQMQVQQFAKTLAELKPLFIHHRESKRLIRAMLLDAGCDPQQTYFDVPRMRTSTSDGYLTSGIAYAFPEHRDTWYSAPFCQINWWLPIFVADASNVMAIHPRHWSKPLPNSSHDYDYQRWNATSRFNAAEQIGIDARVQPKALVPPDAQPDIRIVTPPGGLLVFSGAQLHSSVENQSGRTRFSIDFRTVHLGDAVAIRGAPNVDSCCTGTAMPDYLRVSDLEHVPKDVIDRYMARHPQPPVLDTATYRDSKT